MGCRLFVRGSRGIALTDDGKRLLDRIAPHLDAIEQALRPFAARRDDVLTLSLMPSMASAWLVPRLGAFLGQHPQLEISLQSSVSLVDFARDTDVDAALRSGSGHWQGLIAEYLFDEALVPVASPALVARLGAPTLQELHRWPCSAIPGPLGTLVHHFNTPGRRAMSPTSTTRRRASRRGRRRRIALARMTRARR